MKHKVATGEEWLAARGELLAREKELTRRGDQLAAERGELPWVPIEKEYRFGTDAGPRTLRELFDGRPQLIVYHFMFGPTYTAGCPVCSSAADTFNGAVPHLNARDVTFTCISRAPLDKLQAYKRRMGWSFPWASSHGSDYNFDLEISRPQEATRVPGRRRPPGGRPARAGVRDRAGGVPVRGAGDERLRAAGRNRLPDLLDHRPRAGVHDGLLRVRRPRPARPQRGGPAPALGAPPRRVPRRERDQSLNPRGPGDRAPAAHHHPDNPFGCGAIGSRRGRCAATDRKPLLLN